MGSLHPAFEGGDKLVRTLGENEEEEVEVGWRDSLANCSPFF